MQDVCNTPLQHEEPLIFNYQLSILNFQKGVGRNTRVFFRNNPFAGTNRIRFVGYNLSPPGTPLFLLLAKILDFFKKTNKNLQSLFQSRQLRNVSAKKSAFFCQKCIRVHCLMKQGSLVDELGFVSRCSRLRFKWQDIKSGIKVLMSSFAQSEHQDTLILCYFL